uniref:Uncharacterized protein n=1 Tax=Setaria viridis TaxID=4556 RepID=A0A4U6V1U2_SETVI|nr:hypothetical protein SEVIR_4G265602v2 [Setaria viridis]TKW23021.1 hypothetical protein SEVIR_4G265602v2 [Setaria viridis]
MAAPWQTTTSRRSPPFTWCSASVVGSKSWSWAMDLCVVPGFTSTVQVPPMSLEIVCVFMFWSSRSLLPVLCESYVFWFCLRTFAAVQQLELCDE